MTKVEIIQLAIYILGSGGFLGGIYMLLKLRPEAGQITVTAAQGAVIVQSGVIEDLNEELHRLQDKIKQLETQYKDEIKSLQEENIQLRSRVRELERAKE